MWNICFSIIVSNYSNWVCKCLHVINSCAGERPKDEEDLLQREEMQETHPAQSHPVQEGKGLHLCTGQVKENRSMNAHTEMIA